MNQALVKPTKQPTGKPADGFVARAWKEIAQTLTHMEYPSKSEKLDWHGIFRKTLMDFAILTVPFVLVICVAEFMLAIKGGGRVVRAFRESLVLYAYFYALILFIEMVYCFVIWNPRADRKTERANPS